MILLGCVIPCLPLAVEETTHLPFGLLVMMIPGAFVIKLNIVQKLQKGKLPDDDSSISPGTGMGFT